MLFYLLLVHVYSEVIDLECGEYTYCYLEDVIIKIQPAIDKANNKPTTETDLVLKQILYIDQRIPQFIVQFIANPYPNDEVEHKFVTIGHDAFFFYQNRFNYNTRNSYINRLSSFF